DRAGLKPMPGDRRLSRPRTVTRPSSGGRMPVITRQSVDLPAPLRPMIASTEPLGTLKDTFRRAGMIRPPESTRRNRRRLCVIMSQESIRTRSDAEIPSTSMEGSSRPEGCSRGTTVSPIACPPLCRSLSQAVALTQPPTRTPRTTPTGWETFLPLAPANGATVADTLGEAKMTAASPRPIATTIRGGEGRARSGDCAVRVRPGSAPRPRPCRPPELVGAHLDLLEAGPLEPRRQPVRVPGHVGVALVQRGELVRGR